MVEGTPEISAIAYDITGKRIDRAIRGALKEKSCFRRYTTGSRTTAIINSILNLQKKFVQDKNAMWSEEIQNQVSTMSIIHELYQNTDVSNIGFRLMTRIAGNIIQGYQSQTRVELVTDLDDVKAPLDQPFRVD